MSQDVNGWIQAAVETLGAGLVAFAGLVYRVGRRDKDIDAQLALMTTKEELHDQRLYIDEADKQNRHDIYNFVQREIITKFEASLDKHEKKLDYHEAHDDKRFSELIDRINAGFKDLGDRIADLRVQVAIREATRLRQGRDQEPPIGAP